MSTASSLLKFNEIIKYKHCILACVYLIKKPNVNFSNTEATNTPHIQTHILATTEIMRIGVFFIPNVTLFKSKKGIMMKS